jgi:hypothetical protein
MRITTCTKIFCSRVDIFPKCVLCIFAVLYSSGSQTICPQPKDVGTPIVPVPIKHRILAVTFTCLFWRVRGRSEGMHDQSFGCKCGFGNVFYVVLCKAGHLVSRAAGVQDG